jgi:DNA mismatch endonuclease (patch repair protein)
MVDVLTKNQRRLNMSRIRNKDTAPELWLRSGLHRRGFRFRLHRKDLPGRPDLTLSKYKSAIFVNGCFWHGHGCPMFKIPATRQEFWTAKIKTNRDRDASAISTLAAMGWRTFVLWECALKGPRRKPEEAILEEISLWLNGNNAQGTLQGDSPDTPLLS